jgi:hypothetical protein
VLERHHAHSDSFYTPDPQVFANACGPAVAEECNFDKEDFPDGLQLRWEMIQPTVHVENYTHEVPMDKRRICETCMSRGSIVELGDDHYKAYCKYKCVTNTEFHALKDNQCRSWTPINQDCIG